MVRKMVSCDVKYTEHDFVEHLETFTEDKSKTALQVSGFYFYLLFD